MKRLIALLVVLLGLSSFLYGQDQSDRDRIPLLRGAVLAGRSGVALGFDGYVEANPFQSLGVYALFGHSGISNYRSHDQEVGEVTADEGDIAVGVGFVGRSPEIKRIFRIGGFGQAVYSSSHVQAAYQASYVSPTDGKMVSYQGSYHQANDGPLVTLGLRLEFRAHRYQPPLLVNLGRNFGDGLASHTAGGFYFSAGPSFDLGSNIVRAGKFMAHPFGFGK